AGAAKSFAQLNKEFPNRPERPRVQLRLSQALFQAGEVAEAEASVQDLPRVLDDGALRAEALVLYARCAAKQKHAAEAVKRFEACFQAKIELDEPDVVRSEAVAQAFVAGDSERGLAWTNVLAEQAPKSPCASQAQLHAARWLAEKGKLEEGLARAKWVIDAKSAPAQPMALYLAGFCSIRLRKF